LYWTPANTIIAKQRTIFTYFTRGLPDLSRCFAPTGCVDASLYVATPVF
jgi:hypothetical protein